MSNLRDSISALAATFATSVVAAIRASNLEDIVGLAKEASATPRGRTPATAPKAATAPRAKRTRATSATKSAKRAATSKPAPARKASGRLMRRSPAQIASALAKVVTLVKGSKGGLRAEQIRAQLKMQSKEMPRVLKEGLTKKVLTSKGQKRSTVYSAA